MLRVKSTQNLRNGSTSRSQRHRRSSRRSSRALKEYRPSRESKSCRRTSGALKDIKDAAFVLAGDSMDQVSLLNQIGIEPQVMVVNHKKLSPLTLPLDQLVEEESAAKAQKVAKILTQKRAGYDIVIGCEAVISLDEEVIRQPKDADNALAILLFLSNRWHTIFTGVTLVDSAGRMKKFHVKTDVKFGDVSKETFGEYIKTGECFNHVGAYNIHGKGVEFVESIEGAFPGIPAHQLKVKIRELLSTPKPSPNVHQRLPRVSTSATRRLGTVASIGRLDKKNNNDASSKQQRVGRNSRGCAPPVHTPQDLSYSSKESVASSQTPQVLSCSNSGSTTSKRSTGSECDVECAVYDGTSLLNRNLRSPSEVFEIRGYPSFVDGPRSPVWTKTTGLDASRFEKNGNGSNGGNKKAAKTSKTAAKAKTPKRK